MIHLPPVRVISFLDFPVKGVFLELIPEKNAYPRPLL